MVTHEAVHAHAEQVGQAADAGARGLGRGQVGEAEDGEHDHDEEGLPPHQGRDHLQILGLGHIAEHELADCTNKHGEEYSVHIESAPVVSLPTYLKEGYCFYF